MDEFEFIKSIQQKNYIQSGLIKGVGDDAAVFRQSYKDIVTAVDTFVEDVHFSKSTMNAFHVGYRVLAANISDMAAMGCDPAYYLISIVIPKHWTDQELHEIYQGMHNIAKQYGMDLIGGDTVSGKELVVSVTIIGFVDKDCARLRSSAEDDDIVFVTGTLGDAAAGFFLLQKENDHSPSPYLINRHRMPEPRVAFATALKSINRVTLNDVSDGIGNEAAEIAEASGVTVYINEAKIPVHNELLQFSNEQQIQWKLFGGEDFELIGTVARKDWPMVEEAAIKTGTLVKQIGYVKHEPKKNGTVFLEKAGKITKLDKAGYTHLK
ncbi:thiamine-phosphate kinase [Radiobacillus sp. PE A8.2]|uniref:thiamine-phosphate kinase n=1 Tax=Radiobacillus sp. PE A8.2 TaxID=3380349 RepID=UPI00388F05BE